MPNLDLRKKHQGFWGISPKIAVKDTYALSLVYTPGVGSVSSKIAKDISQSFNLTNRANSIAVITDNHDFSSTSKIPLVEKKATLYNTFAGIDAYPFVLDTSDTLKITNIIQNLAPTFSAFVLTNISEENQLKINQILQDSGFEFPVIYDYHLKTDTKACNEKPLSLLLRCLLDTRCKSIDEEMLSFLYCDKSDCEIIYDTAKFITAKKLNTIDISPNEVKQKFIDFLNEGKKAWIEAPLSPSKMKGLSLQEESIELHKRAKGVIETYCKVNITNFCDKPEETRDAIVQNQDKAYELTLKGNTVAVISDGSAVLGLGNIGPEAAMPVMEGKSSLFSTLAGVDAIPICLSSQNTEELIEIISNLSPVLGGINLEDISAPRCFEIEKQLIERLDIPVFHDDQHGTAVVVLAGFINALKLTGEKPKNIKLVINGAGAGAIAVSKLLLGFGVKNLILCDTKGAIYLGREEGMNPYKEEMAQLTNPNKEKGQLKEIIKNADFFIGLSAGNLVTKEMIKSMAKSPVIFALANPTPEIMPEDALEAGAFIVATGRSDFKNQINNSLAFPGIFRGVLDVRAKAITEQMKISAANAIADLIDEKELKPEYIIPNALNLEIPPIVAKAVAQVALDTNIAQIKTDPEIIFQRTQNFFQEGFLTK